MHVVLVAIYLIMVVVSCVTAVLGAVPSGADAAFLLLNAAAAVSVVILGLPSRLRPWHGYNPPNPPLAFFFVSWPFVILCTVVATLCLGPLHWLAGAGAAYMLLGAIAFAIMDYGGRRPADP